MAEQYYVPPELPKETRQSIDRFVDLSLRKPEDYHSLNMKGVGETAGFLKKDRSFEKNLGMNDVGLSDAIAEKANRGYYQTVRGLESQSKMDAQDQHFRRLEHAADLVNQEFKYNEHVKLMKYQAKMARKKARAGVIGSVLGIAGAVVGGVYGGPAGAMAGYQVGQGIGGMTAN